MDYMEGDFKGVRNTKIYFQTWLPEGDAKAVLLITHGLGEHCGRYMNVVNHFVPLGYAVYGLDHLAAPHPRFDRGEVSEGDSACQLGEDDTSLRNIVIG